MLRAMILGLVGLGLTFGPGCLPLRSGRVTVDWQLTDGSGRIVACIAGEEVHLVIAGQRFIANCAVGRLTTAPVLVGNYAAAIEFHPANGGAVTVVTQRVDVLRDRTTDLGLVQFVVSDATGSATFSWAIHETYLENPAQGCVASESIYIEIEGVAPVVTDCVTYGSQPITGLTPGPHAAYIALQANGTLKDDPRPGYGFTEVNVNFTVMAGQDTLVAVDFVVAASVTRSNRPPGLGLAPVVERRTE